MTQMVDHAVESSAAPRLAEAYGRSDMTAAQRVIDSSIRLSAPLSLLAMAGAIPFGRWGLGLFGTEFKDGYWVLVILLAGNLVAAIDGPVGVAVSLSGLERVYAAIMIAGAAVAVAALLLTAAFGGPVTVAIASASVVILINVTLAIVARVRLGLKCWPRWSIASRAEANAQGTAQLADT